MDIPLGGYFWTCKKYKPFTELTSQSMINCSYAYLNQIAKLYDEYLYWKTRKEKLENDIPSQNFDEKFSGFDLKKDDKVVKYIEAKTKTEEKETEYFERLTIVNNLIARFQFDYIHIIISYYIFGRTASEVAKKCGLSERHFYRKCNEALEHLYDYLDSEFQDLVEVENVEV